MEKGSPAEALMSLRDAGKKGGKSMENTSPTSSRSQQRSRKRTQACITDISDDDNITEGEEWVNPRSPKVVMASSFVLTTNVYFKNYVNSVQRKGDVAVLTRKIKSTGAVKTISWGSIFTFAEKRMMKRIKLVLNNLLKQSKARRWVCYEFFYSDIDRTLFEGENDFSLCLQEQFPNLKTRKLNKTQWAMVRRLMGKPRRCSPAFFDEERKALEAKRKKIRYLLQRKGTEASDVSNFKDLPEEIPCSIVIGTKVTARLRSPQDGLFVGQVDAVDSINHSYRVTFEREGLGTHSIPDFEVLSNDGGQTLPLSSLIVKERPRPNIFQASPPRLAPAPSPSTNEQPIAACPARVKLQLALGKEDSGATYGGFPIKFLVLVTRLSKILTVKKKFIEKLQEMNSEAERKESHSDIFTRDFQKRYASLVLQLDKLNENLSPCLQGVQDFSEQFGPESGMIGVDSPFLIKRQCEEEAKEILAANPKVHSIQNEHILDLVEKFTSLMLQIKELAENDMKTFELTSLSETVGEIKKRSALRTSNLSWITLRLT